MIGVGGRLFSGLLFFLSGGGDFGGFCIYLLDKALAILLDRLGTLQGLLKRSCLCLFALPLVTAQTAALWAKTCQATRTATASW